MRYTSYLFDFDGTLVNSMPSYISAMLRILDENGVAYGEDIIKIITPLGYAGTARYYIEALDVPLTEAEIVAQMKEYAYFEYAHRIAAKENVIATLHQLKQQGADLHILTASPHEVLDVCLKRLGMYDLFDNVWSCDDFGTTKTDVNIYQMAAARIGRPVGDILFLDDNFNADKTAALAGMRVCGVFDPSSKDYTDEIKSVSHHYITDFSEILSL